MEKTCKYCSLTFDTRININDIEYTYARRDTCYACNPSHLDDAYTKSEKEAIRRNSKKIYLQRINKKYIYPKKSSKYRNRCKLDIFNMFGGLCNKCGCRRAPFVYDLHHEDESKKEFAINGIFRITDIVLDELDKCIMVCANCHAEIHEYLDLNKHNKTIAAKYMSRIRSDMKHKLVVYKGGCCVLCGYHKSNRALSFHHVNPDDKRFTISNNLMKKLDVLLSEVDKCMLVCVNCHREIHDELNNLK